MEFDRELDVQGLKCPLPILRTKESTGRDGVGRRLRVLATDPGAAKDFETFARQTGNQLLSNTAEGGVFSSSSGASSFCKLRPLIRFRR